MTTNSLADLVGKSVEAIYWSAEQLAFKVSNGEVIRYDAWADCCANSYFHDFYGVAHLLHNGPIVSTREIPLEGHEENREDGNPVVECYGHELVTVHPKWGEVTSVLSFRTASNGYYGGFIERTGRVPAEPMETITADQTGD
jgi:hypothetical protein